MKDNGDSVGEGGKVTVSGEDRMAPPRGDGANQEISIRALNATRSALIEEICRQLVIVRL